MHQKKIVIVGATSAIAEHCARRWVENEAVHLILVVRNLKKAEAIAKDLKVRSPTSQIEIRELDFLNPDAIQNLVQEIGKGGPISLALIAHGFLPEQEACENDLAKTMSALSINGISPVLFLEAFAKEMQKANMGTLAIIGSVAGDRARKSNYVYGASKGFVHRYVEGLQHRFAGTDVSVILIKPGPTDTPMTQKLKQEGKRLASVKEVANDIITGIARKKAIIYTPGKWRFIMMVVKALPNFIFHRTNF